VLELVLELWSYWSYGRIGVMVVFPKGFKAAILLETKMFRDSYP
jgi:hypothetical protein